MTPMIFINSAHRPDNVRTTDQFPDDWRDYVSIVVPHDEWKRYRRNNDWHVLSVPEDVPCYLSSQRQWCMEYAQDQGIDAVWFMDDDLKFQWRDSALKLYNCVDEDMEEMFAAMSDHLDEVPIVGISTRLGNNRCEYAYEDITRVTRCYAIDVEEFFEVGATMAPFEPFLMQDFHINLCFLEAGRKNRVLFDFAQGDAGSNAEGGVSNYRTKELLAKISNWMAKNHPGVVQVREKRTKGSWQGFEPDEDGFITRTDVVVQWKKAYERGKRGGGIRSFLKK